MDGKISIYVWIIVVVILVVLITVFKFIGACDSPGQGRASSLTNLQDCERAQKFSDPLGMNYGMNAHPQPLGVV